MGAFALVGAAIGQKVGDQTTSGIRHTHGAVNEGFQHDIGALRADLFHLFKRDFASQHTEIGAERLPEFNRLIGTDVSLSGNKALEFRRVFFQIEKDARIGNQDAVGFQPPQGIDEMRQFFNIFVVSVKIEGQINLLP